jgi:micrococcal nuclease
MFKKAAAICIFSAKAFVAHGGVSPVPVPSASPISGCSHSDTRLNCVKYLGNYDGDTISVEIPEVHPLLGRKVGVRVLGVDTPEMKGKGKCEKDRAKVAREFVADKLSKAKRIDLVNVQRDKYFRVLAEVEVDGHSLSKALREQGHARDYDGGTKDIHDWCPASKSK